MEAMLNNKQRQHNSMKSVSTSIQEGVDHDNDRDNDYLMVDSTTNRILVLTNHNTIPQ